MRVDYKRSLAWSPTVAISWLWGLGFFYAIHVTVTYGWLGFLAFAIPNAFGLFLFGYLLGSPWIDPEKIFGAIQGGYTGLFVLCQLCAVGLTLFGFAAYLWTPLFATGAPLMVTLLLLVGCTVGHALSLRALGRLHMAYLVAGVVAALLALWQLREAHPAPMPLPLARFDSRFYGLLLPTLVGFLLGPWLDVQQWHRVIEMRRRGASSRLAYGGGALLFAGLLALNALLAAAAGTDGIVTTLDGTLAAQPVVAFAIAKAHLPVAGIAFATWAGISAVSTIDGFYLSTRWMQTSVLGRSNSPLLTFVPPALVGSPLWIALAAAAAAAAMVQLNLSMIYLMLPFATLFVSGGLCLVAEAMGVPRQYDATLCTMIGLAAVLMFLVGYAAPLPAFLALAPLVGAVGAAPMVLRLLGFQPPAPPPPVAQPAAEPARATTPVTVLAREQGASHGFDGTTFVLHMTPTYDDTNSVGNIYFANYVRWVGKARELFFDICMPEFDLKTTEYYVLTRSFQHEFRREAREFEPITVRISIARHNRKFVTLAHEIYSDMQGLLGRGEQSLMFVDRDTYRPLDIPRAIIEGFLPYWPRTSPLAAKQGGEIEVRVES